MITKKRQKLYEKLESKIGNTPLINYEGKIPNGNKIFIKMESENPFGSHYDRVFLRLFKKYESEGKIKPGDKVIETSSGSAGISFAGIGKILGYDCYVAMPAGGEKAREEATIRYLTDKNHLILTPKREYVNGFKGFLRNFLPNHKGYFFINHSMGHFDKKTGHPKNNETTLNSLEGIATETLNKIDVDIFIPAIGNGSSLVGPGRVLKNKGATKVIGFETIQSAVGYDLLYPGKYKEKFGINPGTLERHRVPGTSFQGIDFPHIRASLEEKLIDEAVLISDELLDKNYKEKTGEEVPEEIPHWDSIKYDSLGRTGNAGLAVALNLAEKVQNKNFLIIGYDKAERYDQ